MTDERELDRLLGAFFADGTDELADRVLDAALDQIDHTSQRRVVRVPWRSSPMTTMTRVAVAAVIGVIAIGGGIYLTRSNQPDVGAASPTVGPTSSVAPTATPAASQPASSTPSPGAVVPGRSLGVVAFVDTTGRPTNGMVGIDRIWLMDPDGTGAHELFPGGTDDQSRLAWSPDGKTLLFSSHPYLSSERASLRLTDASGSEPRILDTACDGQCVMDDEASYSRDGRHLVFVRHLSLNTFLATMDLASGRVVELRTTRGSDPSRPRWSPDGTRIVFSGSIDGAPAAFIIDADGRNLQRLDTGSPPAGDPDWSPDGSRILLSSLVEEHRDIYTIRPDGTDLRRLTTDQWSWGATWAPDGRILFRRFVADGMGFWTMDADGGDLRLLAQGLPTYMNDSPLATVDAAWQPVP